MKLHLNLRTQQAHFPFYLTEYIYIENPLLWDTSNKPVSLQAGANPNKFGKLPGGSVAGFTN